MRLIHPDDTLHILAVPGTLLLGEVTLPMTQLDSRWITIGYIGHPDKIMIDSGEWEAFKNLINEIDKEIN